MQYQNNSVDTECCNNAERIQNRKAKEFQNKRLCILKTIFRHRSSKTLKNFLEESILSNDILFAENGLKVAFEYEFDISDNVTIQEYIIKLALQIYLWKDYTVAGASQCVDESIKKAIHCLEYREEIYGKEDSK